ncbi:AHH domain-containing protein [uncultured Bradyrhizobium sp.]|uniref:AHH domain-containing protein n=1 Tax=uncultured Bradyrhizobium sp. TaxID=199684 RepID=UPI00261D9A46|nr:AHH domain-containing protein [uncultured Bradyrhizobium sp.]
MDRIRARSVEAQSYSFHPEAIERRGRMSILAYHRMIPQLLRGHPAFDGIDQQKLGIDSIANGIYLPVGRRLAAAMGLSPHAGGHPDIYFGTIKCVLDRIAKIPQADVREAKIRTLLDAMRIGFGNGELHTNLPDGKTLEEFKSTLEKVIKRNEAYVEHPSGCTKRNSGY